MTGSPITYRPEIDGLRTVAVLSVLFFHAGFGSFSGGYVGVDVFFVISGFLITSILVRELSEGRLDLWGFYERRARRILPALYATCVLTIPFAWFLLNPVDMKDYAQSVAAVAAYVSNILFFLEADYFAPAAHLKPLIHTWSLAVEEQYYLLAPLLLAAAWPLRRSGVAIVVAIAFCASLAVSVLQTPADPAAAFYLLPARAWELLLGALLALGLRRWPVERGRELPSLAGMACIAWSVVSYDEATPFPGVHALVPAVGSALVIAFARQGTATHMFLSWRPMVALGLISYSIYLIHQPVIAFATIATFGTLTVPARLLLVLLSIGLAALSYRWVETPFRRRDRTTTRKLLVGASALSVLFVAFGLAGHLSQGFSYRVAERVAWVRNLLPDYEPDNIALYEATRPFRREFEHPFAMQPARQRVLVVGNSHAEDLYGILHGQASLFPGMEVALGFIRIHCFAEDAWPGAADAFFSSPEFAAADTLLVSTRWRLDERMACEGQGQAVSTLDGLEALVVRATQLGKKVAIAGPAPEFPQSASSTLADEVLMRAAASLSGNEAPALVETVNRLYFERRDRLIEDKRVLERFARERRLPFLDKEDYVCDLDRGMCLALTASGEKTMWDYAHVSRAGARVFAERLAALRWFERSGLAAVARAGTSEAAVGGGE